MSAGVLTSPMPPIATSRDPVFARVKVENAETGFYTGHQFRFTRELTAPIVYRFTSTINFILNAQAFSVSSGEYRFYAWRGDNVTEAGVWVPEPVFRKNTVNATYTSGIAIDSGGSITVADRQLYADFEHLKTANSTAQKATIVDGSEGSRYLSAGVYYLEFIGTAEGSYSLAWEERP